MLCLATLSPWRSSTGLGTSEEAWADSWLWTGLVVEAGEPGEAGEEEEVVV